MALGSRNEKNSVSDPQSMARKMLSRIDQHRVFLAPLQSTSDQCWQILLHIYVAATPEARSMAAIAAAIALPTALAKRYFDLLEQYGYVEQSKSEMGFILGLTSNRLSEFETLLAGMDQVAPLYGISSG